MATAETILIVDDDRELRHLLKRLLEQHGFSALEAANSGVAYELLQKMPIDLILLDVMLDGDDGFTICKQLRTLYTLPIIMVTAMGEAVDRVVGLELGADDYITKPFYPREVIARIKSVLRRYQTNTATPVKAESKIHFSGWTLYPKQRRLFSPDNIEVALSAGEYILLEVFLKHPHHILTREQLLDHMHGEQFEIFDRSVDVQISRLRKRIEMNPRNPRLIKTVRSGGYLFACDVEERS